MKILLDGMGGDNAPAAVVEGAVSVVNESEHEIILLGKREEIEEELKKYSFDEKRVRVEDASEVITNDDSPVRAIRSKKDSSMAKGLEMLKNGEGEVFVSAGSTGALMAGGIFILGRIRGIDRPAIASIYPILGSDASLLVDAGANAECKPKTLLDFALMGSIYMRKVLGRENPSVGLVNIGTEAGKGNALCKEAYELLSASGLNFYGNVEGRDIPFGLTDIVVCDGFTGNVILKLTEGLGLSILRTLKKKFTDGARAKLGAAMLLPKIKKIRSEFDYSEYGGAPILGVKGHVVKMHGSADANAVRNTILKAVPYAAENVAGIIESAVTAEAESAGAEAGNAETKESGETEEI